MTRPALIALAVGLGCLAGLGALAGSGAGDILPSYLGAWLFLLAMPVGALPILMMIDLLDIRTLSIEPVLRALAAWVPLAALLAVPIVLHAGNLYPELRAAPNGLFGWWMTPGAFKTRAIVLLAVWIGLALVFARAPAAARPRRLTAAFGLMIHAVVGTVAMTDWVMAVEPGLSSSAAGLLLLVSQSGAAFALAVLVALPSLRGEPVDTALATTLLLLLGGWLFLTFTQYLVVWSANLPREAAWYLRRSAGLGQALEDLAGLTCLLIVAALVTRSGARSLVALVLASAALLVLHGLEMLWFVTPAFRGSFGLQVEDLLGLVGFGAAGYGITLVVGSLSGRSRRVPHGVA